MSPVVQDGYGAAAPLGALVGGEVQAFVPGQATKTNTLVDDLSLSPFASGVTSAGAVSAAGHVLSDLDVISTDSEYCEDYLGTAFDAPCYIATAYFPEGTDMPGNGEEENVQVLVYSTNLVNWTIVPGSGGIISEGDDSNAASLYQVGSSGSNGFLMTYEYSPDAPNFDNHLRFRYYPSFSALIDGDFSNEIQEDTAFKFNSKDGESKDSKIEGTPTITKVVWTGNPSTSVLSVAFHVFDTATDNDTEATGTLTDFKTWTSSVDNSINAGLTNAGYKGAHGQVRYLKYDSTTYRLYEADTVPSDTQGAKPPFLDWHLVLYNGTTGTYTLISIPGITSNGVPNLAIVPNPDGSGNVLVSTVYVFDRFDLSIPDGTLVRYVPIS